MDTTLYLAAITAGLCVIYAFLIKLFPYFFEGRSISWSHIKVSSIALIFVLSAAINFTNGFAGSETLQNRFLHLFGGGFVAFLVCFLAARDADSKINRFQFFLFSLLIVTALGVANELVEFFFQYLHLHVSATTIEDTWLDLMSNTIGALLGSALFVPLYKRD